MVDAFAKLRYLLSLLGLFSLQLLNAQTFDDTAPAYLELQPQFFEEADFINVYFNVKFEDRDADPVGHTGDNIYDHLEQINLQWAGNPIYALEHTALNDYNLGSAYTTSTFDLTRFDTDTFKEYVLTSMSSDITVTYSDVVAYGGNQDVVQARVKIRKEGLGIFSDPIAEDQIRVYARYFDRGSNENSLDAAGIHFSQTFSPAGPDMDDDVTAMFDLDFGDNGGTNPTEYTVGFNIKYEDDVYDYDHIEELNIQWDGQIIFALEHTALKNLDLGSLYTTRTFDESRVGLNDTFKEYIYTAIGSDISVIYDLVTENINGIDQDVLRATVTVRQSGLEQIDTDLSGKFRVYSDYYMRNEDVGTNGAVDITGTGVANVGTIFSDTYDITPIDTDDNVEDIFALDFSDNGGSYPSSFDVSFNIMYQDFVFDHDHIEELNLQWNGTVLYALEHTALKNLNYGSDYTTRTFTEGRIGTGDTFKEYIHTNASDDISLSYTLETENINGRDQDVIKVTVSLDRGALHVADASALTGQLRMYSDYYLRGEGTGTNGPTDHTGTGVVNVGTSFSDTYTIREEALDASEELDFNALDFVEEGYTRLGFKLSDYSGEEISDHIGCVDLWYNDGSGWESMVNIRHSNSKFENDCDTDLSGQGQEDTFTALGRTYTFGLSDEARIEAIGSKYFKNISDTEFTSGDPYIYIRHYVDSDDFDKSISYKLGGTYILKDFDGEKKQGLWDHPGTTTSVQASIAGTFDEIPDIVAPTTSISAAVCGIEISWIEPSSTSWGDADRHIVELLKDNQVIATFNAHDIASHSNAYTDSDVVANTTYDYQVRLVYQRAVNGNIFGDLSSASNILTDNVEIPAGVATAQASCDGDLTISWTWPDAGNPNGYILERDEDGAGFIVLDDNIDGALLSFTDNAVNEGALYTYRIAAFDGLCDLKGDFSPAVTNSRDTINLTTTIVRDALQTSKGYFNDRTELFWNLTGVNEQFVNQFNIYARELGSRVSPVLIENLERNDRSFFHERGEANVIYEYFVTTERVIETECGFEITSSFNIGALQGLTDTYQHLPDSGVAYSIGLRNATAVVNGNVTYSGGIAVPDVKVVVERESSILGRSIYFDGVNDYGQLDHNSYINFDTAMTLTAWIKFENLEKFAVIMEKQGSYGLHVSTDGSAYFYIKSAADNTEHQVAIPSSSIVAGRWMNITTTYSQSTRTLKLYIDGLPFGSEVLPASVTGIGNIEFPFTIGRQHSTQNHYFQGFVDETRLYNRALNDDEVLRESGRITKTDTEGLVAYWKIFEGTGNSLYDAAHEGSFFYKNDMTLNGAAWSTDVPSESQLGVAGYTNRFGNFSIEGIPYSGSGENFRVTPTITLSGVVHEFDPSSTSVYLGDGNLVENGVDFEDISVFEISGQIVYDFEDTDGAGTKSVGSAGVRLFLDGNVPMEDTDGNPIVTDSDGNFSASIPIGLHYISFEKTGHTFSDGARWPSIGFNNFQADVLGVPLYDQTVHKFVGTVAGGTSARDNGIYSVFQSNNLGEAYFDVTSVDNTITRRIETDSLLGIFEVELPPLAYNLSSVKWSIDDLDIVSSGDIEPVDLANPSSYQGLYELDSTLTPILVQSYPTVASESAISNLKIDSITATKIHYSWTLNDADVKTQRHIWISAMDTTEFFSDVDPSAFATGVADANVTFVGSNAYNDNDELPEALILEFVNGSNETHQVGVVFNAFNAEMLYKYDTTGFEYVPDSIFYNTRRDFVYRESPTLDVITAGDSLFRGESIFSINDPSLVEIDLDQLSYPTFFTNEFYRLDIRANEVYTNKDNGAESEIPVTDGNVTVNNGVGVSYVENEDGKKEYFTGNQLAIDEEGLASYYFVGGDPSFVQITSSGQEQNSFTKVINVSLEVEGQVVTWPVDPISNPQRAYVMGASAIPGANFVTKAPETVEFILRDPPGSDSYAYREAGTTFSITEDYVNAGFGGLNASGGGGLGFDLSGGGSFGGHIEVGGEVDARINAGIKTSLDVSSGGSVGRSMETVETITTNDQPIELGASDVFVAKSSNLETGYALKVRPLPLTQCGDNCFGDIITMPDGSQYQMGVVQASYINPDGFPTYVVYTQNHIETVLIPDIEELRNTIFASNSNYTSKIGTDHEMYGTNNDDSDWGASATSTNYITTEAADIDGQSYTFNNGGNGRLQDSVRWYNQQIRLWEEALAFNEIEKWAAFRSNGVENVSLASGVQLERSSTNIASNTSMISMETTTALEVDISVNVQFILAVQGNLNAELGIKTNATTTTGSESSNTFGYVLHDGDENDAYSIDIAPGVGGSSPVFSTVAGQTSCPFEPGIELKYATPEFIDKAILDRQALIVSLNKELNIIERLKVKIVAELAIIEQELKDLERDIVTYTESQIEMIKTKVDVTELFNEIQEIVKSVSENAANSLVQKAVGPVIGGVNDFIGSLQDINIPIPFSRGVSPFEDIPTIPQPDSPSGDFAIDFGQVEAFMLVRLKEAEEIATQTIGETTSLILSVQSKIKKRLLKLNFVVEELKAIELDQDRIKDEIAAVENQILQFQALQGILQTTTEPIMLSNSTLQREKPTLLINGADEAQVYNVPAEEKANFNLLLGNESESGDAMYYNIQTITSTNPNGLILSIDGLNVATPREFLVEGAGAIQKVLQVERGPFEYDYEDVQVIISSTCQYDPTRNTALIADTVSLDVRFLPTCTDLEIIVPDNNWVGNNRNNGTLPVTVGEYDINATGLESIKVQYKTQDASDWTLLETYYRDENAPDWTTGDAVLPQSGNTFTYAWDISLITDGEYDIRAVSNCTLAEATSEIHSGIIDKVNPHPFGTPEPADGVLSPGDEIAIRFNEPINEGLLKPSDFSITGVLNGGDIRHDASVRFGGTDAEYMEIGQGLDFTRKSFSIDFQIKRSANGASVLFSQGGAATRSLVIGFNADNQPYLRLNDVEIVSSAAITDPDWHHLAFVYDYVVSDALIYDNGTLVASNNSFSPDYQSSGRVFVGKSTFDAPLPFDGQIHELRVWNKPLSIIEVNVGATKRLPSNQRGLVANWRMEEAHGNIAEEHVSSKNATVYAGWAVEPAGYAYQFDGSSSLQAISPIFNDDADFTIEFWVQGAVANDSVTLVSNGTGDSRDINEASWAIGTTDLGALLVKGGGMSLVTEYIVLDNSWHQVAISMNRVGNLTVFVDGKEVKSTNSGGWPAFDGAALYLGARGWGSFANNIVDQRFTGSLDEIRIWKSFRSADLINADLHNKLGGDETGLVSYYPFESFQDIGGGIFGISEEITNQAIQGVASDLMNSSSSAFVTNTPTIKLPRLVEKVGFNISSNGDMIILSPTIDASKIEDVILSISVNNLRDMNGNKLASPITWSAFVDKSTLNWVASDVNLELPLGLGANFTVEIFNRGGNIEDFSLTNLPDWLSASPSSGSIEPLATQSVSFTVDANTNIGTYVEDVVMENSFGFDQRLLLNLDVYQTAPIDWAVNPAEYEYSMSVIGRVRISGDYSRDERDLLAAFVDGECRGVTSLIYNDSQDNFQSFLSIYSNNLLGEDITYQIWNASEGLVHTFVTTSESGTETFTSDAFYGNILSPVIFDGGLSIEKSQEIVSGWQWLSFNLSSTDQAAVANFMKDFEAVEGDQIKSNGFFDQYDPDNGWLGSITANGGVKNGEMYKFRLAKAGQLKYRGEPIDPFTHPISLETGWNWISFLGQNLIPINEALSNVAGLQVGDVIKSQKQFAIYAGSGIGWVGSLQVMMPGEGYLYNAAGSGSIIYPKVSTSSARVASPNYSLYDLDSYQLNPAQFANNMTMVIATDFEFDYLLAYVDGELRGIAEYDGNDDSGQYFMTVFGDEDGKELKFYGVFRDEKIALTGSQTYDFSTNHSYGTLDRPVELKNLNSLGSTAIDGLQIYPNPTADVAKILTRETSYHTVHVLDLSGRILSTRENVSGMHTIELDMRLFENGVYIIELIGDQQTNRLRLIKQ